MLQVIQSATFASWLGSLKDRRAQIRINARIRRLSLGNPGDAKSVGSGVREMRINYGPGYRIYFAQRSRVIAVLLCGGDKRTQDSDIKLAIKIAKDWTE